MSLSYQSVATLIRTWPALTAVAMFIIFILGILSTNGYIDPAMHRSDMSLINRHITEIEDTLNDNKQEHRSMQTDIRSILMTLGRIEGRIGVNEVHR